MGITLVTGLAIIAIAGVIYGIVGLLFLSEKAEILVNNWFKINVRNKSLIVIYMLGSICFVLLV